MTFDQLKEKALSLPLKPGVYLMIDREGTVIYVGKAKALKNRVVSYFRENASHTEKVRQMVAHVLDGLTDEEAECTLRALGRVAEFFRRGAPERG